MDAVGPRDSAARRQVAGLGRPVFARDTERQAVVGDRGRVETQRLTEISRLRVAPL